MWSNDEHSTLILSIECQVLKIHPITSTNNNHDFTGNLLEIIDNWSEIAEKLKRSGELNYHRDGKKTTIEFCCTFYAKLDVFFFFWLVSLFLNDI